MRQRCFTFVSEARSFSKLHLFLWREVILLNRQTCPRQCQCFLWAIANFQFGRPWAGEGPDLDWSGRTCCRSCRTLTGSPCTGLFAAADAAGQSCPGPRAAAHEVASAVVIPARQSCARARHLHLPGRGSFRRPRTGMHDRTAPAGAGL
jgi:hypothetical protein